MSMSDYSTKEKARITVGAIASLVIVGWLVVLAIAVLSAR
jgi:succinate dehydrogenase hydrophobic anchor subunit